jgi:hypothetical protein
MKRILKGKIMRRSMRYCLPAILLAVLATASSTVFASLIVLSDDFSGGNGNLVGTPPDVSTGNWSQTGATATNPIQVSSNKAAIGPTGQDVYAAFSQSIADIGPNAYLHTSMDINLSAVGTGDYFSHLSDPAGTTSFFFQRLGAVATTGGYFLTLAVTGGGGAATTPGTTVLSLNASHHVDVYWNFVGTGGLNDTFSVYVDNSVTPDISKTWDSTNAEPLQVSAGNFRQGGGAAAAPTLTADNLQVDYVPEPASLLLAGVAGLLGLAVRRSRS